MPRLFASLSQLTRPEPCPYCGARLRVISHPLSIDVIDAYLDAVAAARSEHDLIAAAERYRLDETD